MLFYGKMLMNHYSFQPPQKEYTVEHRRFVSIDQFRSLGNEARGELGNQLNIPLLAATIIGEVCRKGMTLKAFLLNEVLSNHGTIGPLEIRDLVHTIFAGEKADETLGSLDRDKCLGYSPEEIRCIRLALKSPDAENYRETFIREAIGFKVFRRH